MWPAVGVPGVSGMDASLRLCISDSPTLVCSARGVGWLGGASASKAVARDSLVSRAKAGGVCVARMLRKSDTLTALRAQDYRRDKCLGVYVALWPVCFLHTYFV